MLFFQGETLIKQENMLFRMKKSDTLAGFSAGQFPQKKTGRFPDEILIFKIDDRKPQRLILIFYDPDIQKPFADKSENPRIIIAVITDIQTLFHFKKNIKKPGAVIIQKIPPHDKHIEP